MGLNSCTKMALKSLKDLGIMQRTFSAFSRKAVPGVGEELTHRITGQRFFRDADLVAGNCIVKGHAREITKDGYKGIPDEQFEALKGLEIKIKDVAYGNKTLWDDFTGQEYWYHSMTDGKPNGMTQGRVCRESLGINIGEKIKELIE